MAFKIRDFEIPRFQIGMMALFGFLNRWNDTFATTLEPDCAAFAQKLLGGSGWEIGKHA